jgi:hypothetical protein
LPDDAAQPDSPIAPDMTATFGNPDALLNPRPVAVVPVTVPAQPLRCHGMTQLRQHDDLMSGPHADVEQEKARLRKEVFCCARRGKCRKRPHKRIERPERKRDDAKRFCGRPIRDPRRAMRRRGHSIAARIRETAK